MLHLHLQEQALGLVSQSILLLTPLTIQEGQQLITQAITECPIEARGLGQPCSHPSTPQLFRFHCPGDSPQKDCPRDASFDHHPTGHREAGIAIDVEGTRGYYHLDHSHLPQIMDLKVIGVQC